ncbi:MAG: alpha/beta fold hydrolase [Marinibacterium sp.]|nr:alpha/beta fold hydrolase [Marinibacterium sp.]
MPTLTLPDLELYYEDSGGDGPPILLIAGFASDSASWLPILPHLTGADAPGPRLIRPDNRSTGRSAPWDAPTDIGRNADDCAALLDHLGIERAHVVGHSMGGLIGMGLATQHPDRVASLMLAAIAPLRMARNVALFDAMVAIRRSDAAPDTWLRAFYPWIFRAASFEIPGAIDTALSLALAYPYAQSVDAMEHQLRALDSYDPSGVAVSCRVQALLGAEDLLIPEAPARAALAALDGIDIHRIDNAAHAVHWDAPQAVAEHILRFIAD